MARECKQGLSRRDVMRLGAIAGGVAVAEQGVVTTAFANRHPAPRPTSLKYLDRNTYRRNADVRAIIETGHHRGNKMQMMAVGARRFIFQAGDVIEVTDALKPVMLSRKAFIGGQLQLAFNNKLKKWILMTGAGVAGTFSTPKYPNGKYDNPDMIKQNIEQKGLRGVRSTMPPIRPRLCRYRSGAATRVTPSGSCKPVRAPTAATTTAGATRTWTRRPTIVSRGWKARCATTPTASRSST